jgi:hypothetical protein
MSDLAVTGRRGWLGQFLCLGPPALPRTGARNPGPVYLSRRHGGADLADQIGTGADLDHFDIAVWGQRDEKMVSREDERFAQWADSGVTWFLTGPGPFNLVYDEVREYVANDPPRS